MEFRDLHRQYILLKKDIDKTIEEVLLSGKYISGLPVIELEQKLARYVGRKYCITCANGTDALELALRALKIKDGDAVFVPDFTFFASGEVVSTVGAMPVFVDVEEDTYNISSEALESEILRVLSAGVYQPKAIIAVDLFGQPANYTEITKIAKKYGMYLIEDAAQGFGGSIGEKKACSFGDISATSFFPAKPLGCYGDGGAIFTDSDIWEKDMRSLCIHGKSDKSKYDNIQIGMNSRLDSIQAAILLVKFEEFRKRELYSINKIAKMYSEKLKDIVKIPYIKQNYSSSWAQYTIQVESKEKRETILNALKKENIPFAIYYEKPLHKQMAFSNNRCIHGTNINALKLSDTVISLPISPYILDEEVEQVVQCIYHVL